MAASSGCRTSIEGGPAGRAARPLSGLFPGLLRVFSGPSPGPCHPGPCHPGPGGRQPPLHRGLDFASLTVSPGETVVRGALLGFLGQPPTAGQPAFLGLHLQDTALLGEGAGLRLRFGTLSVQGELRENVVPQGALLRSDGALGWRIARPDPGP